MSKPMKFPVVRVSAPCWPDMRGWALIGSLGLTAYILHMIEQNPSLLAVASFMQFAGSVFTGTLGLLFFNLFGGTKSGTETSAKIADAYANSTPAPPTPPKPPPVPPLEPGQPPADTVTLEPGDSVVVDAPADGKP